MVASERNFLDISCYFMPSASPICGSLSCCLSSKLPILLVYKMFVGWIPAHHGSRWSLSEAALVHSMCPLSSSMSELPHNHWKYLAGYSIIPLKILLVGIVCAKHWSSLCEVRLQRVQRPLFRYAYSTSSLSTDGCLALAFATNSLTERLSMSQHCSPQH